MKRFPSLVLPLSLFLSLSWTTISAQVASPYSQIRTLRSQDNRDDQQNGNYNWSYDLSDGTRNEQRGRLDSDGNQVVEGGFNYISKEGQPVSFTYVADKDGYRPMSDSIPTPPPIPEAIQRLLYILYTNAQEQVKRAQRGNQNAQRSAAISSPISSSTPNKRNVRIVRRIRKIPKNQPA